MVGHQSTVEHSTNHDTQKNHEPERWRRGLYLLETFKKEKKKVYRKLTF